jgi:DNA-binding transcriptional LysR family regulator
MELRHLRYVVAIAETLHFRRAAERLHISQPPLSQQVRQLENELGVKLFQRTKRHVQLTEAGKMVVEEARLILAQTEHVAQVAARVNNGEAGQLVIGVAGPADAQFFVDILRLFGKRHPNVRIVVRNISTADQVQAVRERRLHAGFVTPPVDDPELAYETVIRRPIVIALPRTHPLATRRKVPLRALAGESHVMFARALAPRVFDATISSCREAGFNLNVVHEVDNLYSACALVAAGLGVCFVPDGIQEVRSRQIVLRPLSPRLPHIDSSLAVVYRRDLLSNLVRQFLAAVRDVRARSRQRESSRRNGSSEPKRSSRR